MQIGGGTFEASTLVLVPVLPLFVGVGAVVTVFGIPPVVAEPGPPAEADPPPAPVVAVPDPDAPSAVLDPPEPLVTETEGLAEGVLVQAGPFWRF